MAEQGYSFEPPVSGGKYLSLSKKGDTATFRIASLPQSQNKHWLLGDDGKKRPVNCDAPTIRERTEFRESERAKKTKDAKYEIKILPNNCPYCGDKVPSGEKIDKDSQSMWIVIDQEDGQAKIFKGTKMTYLAIKELAEDPDWGGFPEMTYPIRVTRTEEPGGGYYKVTPLPTDRRPLNKAELEAVEKADYDLIAEVRGEVKSKSEMGAASAEELETASAKEKVNVSKGNTDEEISPDEIPF